MEDEKKYYCFCGSNCRYETMTKEQILAAIANAINTGSVGNCDTGFVTKVKEQNSGGCVTFWVGTQAQYNALEEKSLNCLYIITDDTTTADMKAAFAAAVTAAEESAAAASAAVASAASAASDVVATLMPIDITDQLTFTLGDYNPAGVNRLSTSDPMTKFVYSPSTKLVYFNLLFNVQGSMKAGDLFSIKIGGKYLPSNQASVMCSSVKCQAALTKTGSFLLTACADMTNFEGNNLTGWYFCDGEGV